MPTVIVADAPERHRYEIRVDGALAGYAVYVVKGNRWLFVHTEIADEFEGRGYASTLVREALDDIRARGITIVPLCPFVAAWIERHPDYDDLVDHALLQHIETTR